MSSLKRIWNKKESKDRSEGAGVKRIALKGLLWVTLLLVCCTILSRIADGLTVAVVRTQTPASSAIQHAFSFEGRVESDPKNDLPVTARPGLLIEQILVTEGQRVRAGDTLLVLDASPLREEYVALQRQADALTLQYKGARNDAHALSKEQDTQLDRATEDYYTALSDAERAIQNAQEDVEMAQQAVVRQQFSRYPSEEAIAAAETQLRLQERALEEAQLNYEKIQKEYKRRMQDADAATVSYSNAKLLELQLSQVKEDMQNLAELAGVSVPTADTEEDDNKKTAEAPAVQVDDFPATLSVTAPKDGIVTSVRTGVGDLTGSAALLLINSGESLRFIGTITQEQAEFAKVGAELSVLFYGEKEACRLSVSELAPSRQSESLLELSAAIPQDLQIAPGTGGKAECRQRSQQYELCLPISALYRESAQPYVLVAGETETALGSEWVLTAVEVEVLESNETMAAVNGGLNIRSQVVVGADRPVRAGSRVRLE